MPSFEDAFKRLTQHAGELPLNNDVVLALLVEPQSTTPTVSGSENGDIMVNPLNLPLIDNHLDAAILPLVNSVFMNGKLPPFGDLPTIEVGGKEYVSVDILKDFSGNSCIPETPPIMLPPMVSSAEHSKSTMGSRVATGDGASSTPPITSSTRGKHAHHTSNLAVDAMLSNADLMNHLFSKFQNLMHGNMPWNFQVAVFCTAANGSNISQSCTPFVTSSRFESTRKRQRRLRKRRN